MKTRFLPAFVVVTCVGLLCRQVAGQIVGHARPYAAYHPNDLLDPTTLMSPNEFYRTANRHYVFVEGYINYVAGSVSPSRSTTKIKTEDDGDYHFEMQSTNTPRGGGTNPNGLVCEIDPAWQLNNWNLLSQISQKHPETYRKIRVYGWLRYGTERGHSGSKDYILNGGTKFTGHWEIHPVERIVAADNRGPLDIGPSAKVRTSPIANRYKLTNATFAKPLPSNYAKLSGRVTQIAKSSDASGDFDLLISLGTRTFTATVPQYYVSAFNGNTQTLSLVHVLNFSRIGYSIKPGAATRTFYGLRTWHFGQTGPYPALQPVEMIR